MSVHHTKTVESAYMGRDGKPRCFVKGDAVIVKGNRAEKAR